MGEEEKPNPLGNSETTDRTKRLLTTVAAYAMPLLASTPNIYMGFMTIPLLGYLILMMTNLSAYPEGPLFLLLGGSPLDAVVLIFGLAFTAYSVVFLVRKRSAGLVTAGPYRIVRHPQYLGFILLTGALTSKSVWIECEEVLVLCEDALKECSVLGESPAEGVMEYSPDLGFDFGPAWIGHVRSASETSDSVICSLITASRTCTKGINPFSDWWKTLPHVSED